MSASTNIETVVAPLPVRSTVAGPVTARKLRRTLWTYLAFAGAGTALTLTASPVTTAFGLGLVLPGGGFWYVDDPVMAIASPVVVVVIGGLTWITTGAMFVWPLLWVLTAALAAHHALGLLHHGHALSWALWAVPATAAGVILLSLVTRQVAWRRGRRRIATLNSALAEKGRQQTQVAADRRPTELSAQDLALSRFVVDLALQPHDSFTGFEVIEQFQLSSLRYQLTGAQMALAAYQSSHVPAFTGYLAEAQRAIIIKMTHPKVWGYWFWENLLGNFRVDRDPIVHENIMFSGYLAAMLGSYTAVNDDDRFNTDGALTFTHRDRQFRYDHHSIVRAVYDNMDRSDFCLYPCEPNFVYSVCNAIGLAGLAGYDHRYQTDYTGRIRERFVTAWDNEFTGFSGRPILMRSRRLGLTLPTVKMAANDAVIAVALRPVLPEIAARTWEVMRLQALDLTGEFARVRLAPWERVDPGSYRLSAATTYATLAATASAMGDTELCSAMLDLIERDHQPVNRNGASRLPALSVLSNMAYITAKLHRPQRPQLAAGPQLVHVDYPDVQVVSAVNRDGALDLTLQPSSDDLSLTPLKFSRLAPSCRYRLITDRANEVEIVADSRGEALARIPLDGRSRITLQPCT